MISGKTLKIKIEGLISMSYDYSASVLPQNVLVNHDLTYATPVE